MSEAVLPETSMFEVEQPMVEALIGVRLTESCLMIPNKSLSGLLFPSEFGYENCAVCPREGCRGRRAPYDPDVAAMLGARAAR